MIVSVCCVVLFVWCFCLFGFLFVLSRSSPPGWVEVPKEVHKEPPIVRHDSAQPLLVSPVSELARVPGITAVNGLGTDVQVPDQNDSPAGSQASLHAALQRLYVNDTTWHKLGHEQEEAEGVNELKSRAMAQAAKQRQRRCLGKKIENPDGLCKHGLCFCACTVARCSSNIADTLMCETKAMACKISCVSTG